MFFSMSASFILENNHLFFFFLTRGIKILIKYPEYVLSFNEQPVSTWSLNELVGGKPDLQQTVFCMF